MWNHEVSADTEAPLEAVWAQYVDLNGWPKWNPGTQKIELKGAFATGSEGVITSAAYGDVPFKLASVVDKESFVIESPVNEDVVLRTSCHVAALPSGGARITHRVELEGPGSEQMGATLGEDLSKNLAAGAQALVEATA
ncbi:SRPBCC family protein [Streptomyces griseoviridis]